MVGVVETLGLAYRARAVLITTGTFLNGLIHIGETRIQAGRAGEFAGTAWPPISRNWGFRWGAEDRHPAALRAGSIDFAGMSRLEGDPGPGPFSCDPGVEGSSPRFYHPHRRTTDRRIKDTSTSLPCTEGRSG